MISTLVETHLLFSLVFFQTFGFIFERRTFEDLATLSDIKLEEIAVFGIFIVNSVIVVLVFGMRPRDVDDFDLTSFQKKFPKKFASTSQSRTHLAFDAEDQLYADPTIGFTQICQYVVIYSWFAIFFFQAYSLYRSMQRDKDFQR